MKYDYDGSSWVNVGDAGFSAGAAFYTSIVLDSKDIPFVVYQDAGNSNQATVMKLALLKFTASASAASATPIAGADNEITLTVKDAMGNTDTTFSGVHNVTVSGYTAAPDGSYGYFNGTGLTAGPNTISVTFASGVATANLKLNKAEAQTIGFSVEDVATPDTNTVSITPVAGSAASMALTTDITAPTSNGGAFAQQPVVTLYDSYGNTSTGDSSTVVTVSKKDAGTWTLTGTVTATASSGVVSFTGLGATNTAAVTGAKLAFDASGLTQIESLAVTLPDPDVPIGTAAIAGVTAPVRGATPVSTLTSTAEYTATIAWSPSDATFASNTVYTATITITPKTGYTLTGVPANFFTVAGATATNAANSGTITAEFPATASNTGGGGGSPAAPSEPPVDQEQTPVTPEPSVHVFQRSIVNEADLVQTYESKAAEAKLANETVELADTQGHWAEQTVDIFVQVKLISGYPDGSFRPDKPITRAEFASILNRAFQIQGGRNTSTLLKDIDGSRAKGDIENLVAAGVISGYPDGTFRPNQTVTREEIVVMLSRIVDLSGLEKDTTKGNFKDLSGAYAADEIQAAAQAGIVSGKGNGGFDPKKNATRAEALQFILNVLKLNPQLKTLLDSLS